MKYIGRNINLERNELGENPNGPRNISQETIVKILACGERLLGEFLFICVYVMGVLASDYINMMK